MKISVQFGKGNLRHNSRSYIAKNINTDLSKNNLISKNSVRDNKEFREKFNAIFKSAIENYNANQKRNDRKINDYYKACKNNQKYKDKLMYEIIFQIGNYNDKIDKEQAKNILEQYANRFEYLYNKNLVVIGSYIHMDESVPHLHLDFVPIGNFEKGLSKRLGLKKALEEQGFTQKSSLKRFEFIKTLKNDFQEHCTSFGLVLEDHASDTQEKHQNISDYREKQKQLTRKLSDIEENVLKELPNTKETFNKQGVIVSKTDFVKIEKTFQENALLKTEIENLTAFNKALDNKNNNSYSILKSELNDKTQRIVNLENDKKELYDKKEEILTKNKQLESEKASLKAELTNSNNSKLDLKIALAEQKARFNELSTKYEEALEENKKLKWYENMYFSIVNAFYAVNRKIYSVLERFIEQRSRKHNANGELFYVAHHIHREKHQEDAKILDSIYASEQEEEREMGD